MYKPLLLLLLVSQFFFGQNPNYTTLTVPDALKESANSIVRADDIVVNITSSKSYTISRKRVVTIFNKKGEDHIDAYLSYSPSEKVIQLQLTVYNAMGMEIKKFKKSDFTDQSVADGFSLLTDNRVLFLDYTPTEFPLTFVFESELKTINTAFIASWSPYENYYSSIQKSSVTYKYPEDLTLRIKEENFEGRTITKTEQKGVLSYTVENLPAEKREDYAPSTDQIFPKVRVALNRFSLEGVDGEVNTWADFGKWMYEGILKGTDELSPETIAKVKTLTADCKDPLEKARKIYEYVQGRTRYVSVQLGIGGWKPMLAKDVDRLGYGDCKALSNYTRALLQAVGIESYYTIIYGGDEQFDITPDFVGMQGNHAVLAMPDGKGGYTFMECTSQTVPFGFQGDFTDDRFALLIKPDKGEVVRTQNYTEKKSTQLSKGSFQITPEGDFKGSLQIVSTGIQYDQASALEGQPKDKLDEHYKSYFSWINNLKVDKCRLTNDKKTVQFTQELEISALGYAKPSGNMILVNVNPFNQSVQVPARYRNRKNPVEITRGFYDEDTFTFTIPEGLKVDVIPDAVQLEDTFGSYSMTVTVKEKEVLVKRTFLLRKGKYPKESYELYRKFREQIARADNAKIVFIKS